MSRSPSSRIFVITSAAFRTQPATTNHHDRVTGMGEPDDRNPLAVVWRLWESPLEGGFLEGSLG